jgi:hypothetical protein
MSSSVSKAVGINFSTEIQILDNVPDIVFGTIWDLWQDVEICIKI